MPAHNQTQPATPDQKLETALSAFFTAAPFLKNMPVAVAVSGGSDSMALTHALSRSPHIEQPVHALIVDHGLREGSAQEARSVYETLAAWDTVRPQILRWEGDKPATRIQELAREARYKLLVSKAASLGCAALFLGHQQDDLAETVLMRLARGSGPKGLSGLRPLTHRERLPIARPLLTVSRATLLDYCDAHKISYVTDPSNADHKYERVRLREALAVLPDAENIQANIATSARRILEMEDAFEELARTLLATAREGNDLRLDIFRAQPETLAVRGLIMAIEAFRDAPYPLSLEAAERLLPEFLASPKKSSLCLGSVRLTIRPKDNLIELSPENS